MYIIPECEDLRCITLGVDSVQHESENNSKDQGAPSLRVQCSITRICGVGRCSMTDRCGTLGHLILDRPTSCSWQLAAASFLKAYIRLLDYPGLRGSGSNG